MTSGVDSIRLVDSHCHIDFPDLSSDVAGVIRRMADNHVTHALCVSVTMEHFPRVRDLAIAHREIFASVGVHPDTTDCHDPSVEQLVREAGARRVLAIGETGLDYFRAEGNLDWQRERFRRHVRAARQVNKPLIIHCREAADDLLRILRDEAARDVGGVMHCFTESWEVAAAAMDMNFMISFSGIVTFKNASALREVAVKVPRERLLVETDSPYLAPVPYRGTTNEPAYVRHVAESLAKTRETSLQDIAATTTANFERMFNASLE